MPTYVIAKDGTRLMPTFNIKKVRNLLKTKKAIIYCYEPFTIQLCYDSTKNTQPIEFTEDTGYANIGLSLKSAKHEYVNEEYVLPTMEVENHKTCSKLRRTRRNRLRYKAKRFDNRKIPKKWLAPSLRHKKELHIQIFKKYLKVVPITTVYLEVGQFDTQILTAIESGNKLPQGIEYQHGETYGYDTLREAVFSRDNYKCICCGKSAITDKVILNMHHLGFKKGDRTNRLNNLATVCSKCHTAKNHQPGGKLYDLNPKLNNFKGAAYMNSVKWQIYEDFKNIFENTYITYGAVTKRTRLEKNISKTHGNDAYCIGKHLPKHRSKTVRYKKNKRNNRVLEKFYDAKVIDIRDNKTKKGASLGCERTNRKVPRRNENNQRMYRGEKLSKGRRVIRKHRYPLRPNDIVLFNKEKLKVIGVQNEGSYVKLSNNKAVSIDKVTLVCHVGGWSKL